jgi:hypothetical protein
MKRLVLALTVTFLGSGCLNGAPPHEGPGQIPQGSALNSASYSRSSAGFEFSLAVDEEWLLFVAYLQNTSPKPLTLQSARLRSEEGLGSVVEVVNMQVGTLQVPGGIYKTSPPAFDFGQNCHVLKPHPVRGFVLAPGEEARLLVRMHALAPGHFKITAHDIIYLQGGSTYIESIPTGMEADVSSSGEHIQVRPAERRCMPEEGELLGS